jgi:hypothetical protein
MRRYHVAEEILTEKIRTGKIEDTQNPGYDHL